MYICILNGLLKTSQRFYYWKQLLIKLIPRIWRGMTNCNFFQTKCNHYIKIMVSVEAHQILSLRIFYFPIQHFGFSSKLTRKFKNVLCSICSCLIVLVVSSKIIINVIERIAVAYPCHPYSIEHMSALTDGIIL